MEHLAELIQSARQMQCSDIHISEGLPLMLRVQGRLLRAPFEVSPQAMRGMILEGLSAEQQTEVQRGTDIDTALQTSDGNRQRVNVFIREAGLPLQFGCCKQISLR